MKRFLALLLTMAFLCIGSVALADEPEPFDLNKATVEQLMSIPDANITEEMAKAMIEMSKTSPFKISDDLLKVPGLDNGMENNYICTVFSKSFVIKSIIYRQNAIAVKKSKACGRK